jgi:hypothetical protein
MVQCQICDKTHQMGPDIYSGKWIKEYQLQVCKVCFDSNWDGWSPRYEDSILTHLQKNGIREPSRNSNGLLPQVPN